MKLYDGGRAPNPRRVRIFLAEKNISVPLHPVPLHPVDINKLEHKTPAFARLNPVPRTPVLVLDDGTGISESMAICRYFEEVQPLPALFGSDARTRALVEMRTRRLELNLLLTVADVLRHSNPGMAHLEVPQFVEVADASRPRVYEFLSLLNTELADRDFVACDEFSVADITGLVAVDLMKPAKLEMPQDLPKIARWHAAIKARSSASA